MAINGGNIEFGVGFKVDKTGLQSLKNQLNEISKLSSTQIQSMNPKLNMNEAISAMQKVRIAIEEIKPALDKSFDTTTGVINLQKLQSSLQKLNLTEIQNRFNAIGPQGQQAFLKISKAALTTNVTLKETSSFLDKMGTTFINTIKWGIASSVMNNFTGAVQEAYGYVQHLDTSLNDIRIVTNKSAEEMDKFAVKANDAAKSLGQSTTAYTEAALIYYQQGLSDEESQARAETTLKAANVTGQSAQAVSEQLTSVWNGYKVTAEETELYVDKLAAVAASTASDLEELSTGMSKVASAANNMGVDVDQLNAQLATIISVTRQAPETAGTALKTIYARMEDLKIDGSDEDGVKLGEVSSTLDEVGVHIMDTEGNMRDLGEVIEEVGNKWEGWTDAQQSAIAQAIAGKRQYNNLLALFDNWDMYNSSLETSANATGTLQQQQDIYMESTGAHIQELKTEWEDLYDSVLDTDTINITLDGLTKILDKTTDIVDAIGGGKTLITGLLALITTKFSKQVSSIFTPMIKNMQNAKANAEVLQGVLKNIQVQQENGIISGKAAEVMANTQKEMSQYWSIMSEEQINASQNTIREIGDWETKRETIDQTKQSLQLYINQLKNASTLQKSVNASDILSNGSAANLTVTKFLESQSATAIEAQNNFSNLTKEAQKLNTTIKIAQGDTEKLGKINFSSFEKSLQNVRDSVAELRIQANRGLIDESVADKAEQALQRIEERFKKIKSQTNQGYTVTFNKSMLQSLTTINGQLDKTNVKYQEYIKLLKEAGLTESQAAEELERLYNSLNRNDLALEKRTQSISKIIGGLSSLIFTIQSISNIEDVITDENLTNTEKFSQIMTSLAISVPMFLTVISSLKDGLVELVGPTLLNAAVEQDLVGANGAATASGAALIGVKEGEIVTTEQLIIVKLKEIAVMIKEKAVLLLTNPLFILAAVAVTALTSALIVSVKAHKDEVEAIEKSNEASIKASKARQEEIKGYEEAADSLQGLVDKYKEGTISQKEFNEQKTELLANLDAEGRAALNVGESWEEATRALSNYRANLAKQNAKEANDQARMSAENALIAADKGAGYYDTSTQTFSNSGFRKITQGVVAGVSVLNPEIGSIVNARYLAANKDYNNSLKQIDFYLQDTKTKLDDIIDESGNLQLDINNPQSIVDFVDAVDKASQAGVKLDESLTKQASEIRSSGTYADLTASLITEKTETENAYGAESGIDYAETLEEGQAAYDEFMSNLIKKEGYTLQEANDAWVTYLSGLDTEVATQMVNIQTNFDTMTSAFAKKFQGDFDTSRYKAETDEVLQYLTDNNLTEGIHLFTPEEWEDMIIGNMSVEEIGQAVSSKLDQSIQDAFETFKETSGEKEDNLQSLITDAIGGSVDTSEGSVYATLKSQLEELTTYYPELQDEVNTFNNESIIGTQQWIDSVYTLKDAYNDLEFDKLIQEYSDDLEKLHNQIDAVGEDKLDTTEERDENGQLKTEYIEVEADPKKFSETMSEIMDDDYSITVEIEGDITDDFDNLVDSMENMDSMAEKIGEDFIVSAEDITEIAAAYPGILEGYTDLGDGTIQLNEDIAKSAMDAASQAEIASTEELITEIENTNAKLKLKKNHYQTIIDIAQKAANGEIDAQKASTDISTELDKIEEINNDLKSEEVENNATDVADNSAINAGIVSDNWGEAYDNMATDAIESAKVAIKAAKAVADNKKGEIPKSGKVSVAWSGGSKGSTSGIDTSTSNYKSSDETTDSDYWQKEIDNAQTNIDAINKAIASNEAEAVEAAARLGKSVTSNAEVGKVSDDGSSSSSSEDEAETEEYLEREEDIYHSINQELDEIESKLSRIQTTEDHSWGESMQEALKTENALLDDQLAKLEEKKELQEEDLSSQRGTLQSQGFTFSESGGTITNSEERLDELYAEYNAMVDTYNSMSASAQESYKDTLDAKKDTIDDIEEAIETYEDTYSDYQDTLDELLEQHYAEIENEVKSFNNTVEVHLELKEAEQEWNDFWKEVVEDVEDTDFGGQIAASLKQLKTLVGLGDDAEASSVGMLTNQVNKTVEEVWKQINNAENGGEGSLFGDDTALSEETLTDYRDRLMESVRSAKEEVDNIAESYSEILENAQEEIDKQVEGWESIGDQIEHDLKLIELVSGEETYDALNKQYQLQHQNNLELINTQKQSQDFWKEQINRYKQLLANTQEGTVQWKTYSKDLETATKNYRSAVSDLNSTVEKSIQDLQKLYDNQVAKIKDTFDRAISGGMGMDALEQEWKLINEQADRYYDNVERSFAMEGLENEFDKALDNANLSADIQAKINDLRSTEIERLEQRNKLNEFDVEEVKARLEILKQQAALEEAQANKSNMRLRRDSQGNYTYQYTGNEENIDEASDGLMSAKQDWYQLVKNRNIDLAQAIIDNQKNLQNELDQIANAHFDSEDQRDKARLDAIERYKSIELDIMNDAENAKRIFFDGTAQYFADVENNNVLPQWKATVEALIDNWNNGGEDSFIGAIDAGIQGLQAAQQEFETKTREVLDAAGVNYEDLKNDGIDPTRDSLDELVESNEELAEKLAETNDLLTEQEANLKAAEEAYLNLKEAAVDAIEAANEALNVLAETAVTAVSTVSNAATAAENAVTSVKNAANNATKNTASNTNSPTDGTEKIEIESVSDPNGAANTHAVRVVGSSTYLEIVGDNVSYNGVSGWSNYFKKKYPSSQYKYVGFKSGGYTGEWSNNFEDGKLAVLHQKELVLNENDTSNILQAVNTIRKLIGNGNLDTSNLANVITSTAQAQVQALSQISSAVLQGIASTVVNNSDIQNTRNTTINADFSGVRSAEAIYQALSELENYGMQNSYSSSPLANRGF